MNGNLDEASVRLARLELENARLRAENAATRAAERRLQVFFELSTNAHLVFDEGGIFDCNDAAIRMLGCKDKAEVLALHPARLSPAHQPDGRLSLEKCVEMDALAWDRGHHRFEWLHQRMDGTPFLCEVTLSPVMIDGKPSLLAVWNDISESRATTLALRRSEARFGAMVETAPLGVLLTSASGEWLYTNAAFRTLTGVASGTCSGGWAAWAQVIHADDLERVQREWKAAEDARTTPVSSFRLVRRGGIVRHVRMQGAEILEEDACLGRVALLIDMTDQHEFAAALAVRNVELEAARDAALAGAQAKSALLANMSHEFRTPMEGIVGLVAGLTATPLEPVQREQLRLIETSAVRLVTLIDELLDFSKVEAGSVQLCEEDGDLAQIISEVASLVRVAAHTGDNTLSISIEEDFPALQRCDVARVRQILVDIVGNAMKFTRHGAVAIRAGLRPDGRLAIAVSDTGIGISPESRDRLFAPFEQAESTTTRRFGGTCVGLAISRHLARAMGGDVTVSSTESVGSELTLFLPNRASATSNDAGATIAAREAAEMAPGSGSSSQKMTS